MERERERETGRETEGEREQEALVELLGNGSDFVLDRGYSASKSSKREGVWAFNGLIA
jgi:hypothetical protein